MLFKPQARKTTIFSGVSMTQNQMSPVHSFEAHSSSRVVADRLRLLYQLALWIPSVVKTIFNRFHCTNPAEGAIFGGQFDNSSRKSLLYKDFFGFWGEFLRKNFVTTFCELSGLEPSAVS